jgi:hypothetical protein
MRLTDSQMLRLDLEKQIIQKKFGYGFDCYFSRSLEPHVIGWITTTCDRNDYELTLNLGPNFPDERPQLYVTCPMLLKKHRGCGYINDENTSHIFHTWDNGPDSCVQICHSQHWDATHTCVGVLLRGILWLEFYEAYLRNGGDIDKYCG